MRKHCCIVLLVSLCFSAQGATTHYVSTNGSLFAFGTQLDPHLRIQDAINAAASGDTIMVGPGVYSGQGNIRLKFYGKELRLTSSGGSDNTVIEGTDTNFLGRAFTFSSVDTTSTIVRGITIRSFGPESTGTDSTLGDPYYPEVYYTNASAVLMLPGSGARFVSCVFDNNTARDGGAFSLFNSELMLSNCLFQGNTASDHGGAISAENHSHVVAVDCEFVNNHLSVYATATTTIGSPGDPYHSVEIEYPSQQKGGAIYQSGSTALFTRCIFLNNLGGFGGACYGEAASSIELLESRLSGNSSRDNTGDQSGGGGICLVNSSCDARWTTFDNNVAGALRTVETVIIGNPGDPFYQVTVNESGRGSGGAILAASNSWLQVSNCIIRFNVAHQTGGGIAVRDNSTCSVNGTLFAHNGVDSAEHAAPTRSGGGALSAVNLETNLVIRNCEFIGNETEPGTEEVTTLTVGSPGDPFYNQDIDVLRRGGTGGALQLMNAQYCELSLLQIHDGVSYNAPGIFMASCSNASLSDIVINSCKAVGGEMQETTVLTIEGFLVETTTTIEDFPGENGAFVALDAGFDFRRGLLQDGLASDGSAVLLSNCNANIEALLVRMNASGRLTEEKTIEYLWNTTAVFSASQETSKTNGVIIIGGTTVMNHVTITESGVRLIDANVTLINSVIWSTPWQVDGATFITSAYSCVLGIYPGTGNLLGDPMITRGGLIHTNSLCIDAALTNAAYVADYEGEGLTGSGPDMGADEFTDIDSDGIADSWERDYYDSINSLNSTSDIDLDKAFAIDEFLNDSDPNDPFTNGETIPDGWLIGGGLDPRVPQMFLDPDGDTFLTFHEYLADTLPLDSNSYLHVDGFADASNAPAFYWFAASSRWYRLDRHVLSNGTWVTVADGIAGSGTEIFVSDLLTTNPTPTHAQYRVTARNHP